MREFGIDPTSDQTDDISILRRDEQWMKWSTCIASMERNMVRRNASPLLGGLRIDSPRSVLPARIPQVSDTIGHYEAEVPSDKDDGLHVIRRTGQSRRALSN